MVLFPLGGKCHGGRGSISLFHSRKPYRSYSQCKRNEEGLLKVFLWYDWKLNEGFTTKLWLGKINEMQDVIMICKTSQDDLKNECKTKQKT
jgi:hypothetical protein